MRTILAATITIIIILCSAPAFADWCADLAGSSAQQPVFTAAGDALNQAQALKLSSEPAAMETPKPEPIPVFTTANSDKSDPLPAAYKPELEKPRYMVTYHTAPSPHMMGRIFVTDPNPLQAVPEPASLLALTTGFGGLFFKLRRRSQ